MSPDEEAAVQREKNSFDDYFQTVMGLHAFASSCMWDDAARKIRPGSRRCIPRRMTPKEGPYDLTPDAVIQLSQNYGVVAEMKKNFSADGAEATFDQLEGYADNLVGWWTDDETIPTHDVVLLTHLATSVRATDYYSGYLAGGKSLRRPFAIVEFALIDQGKSWFQLRRVAGKLSDSVHDEALRQTKLIDHRILTDVIARARFMEAEPPLVYMMVHIFSHALPLFVAAEEFSTEGARYPTVTVSAEDVRTKLEEQFSALPEDQRSFSLPRTEWVRKALEMFVRIKMAVRIEDTGVKYRIPLRPPRSHDLLPYFAIRIHRLSQQVQRKHVPNQGDLFV